MSLTRDMDLKERGGGWQIIWNGVDTACIFRDRQNMLLQKVFYLLIYKMENAKKKINSSFFFVPEIIGNGV